MAKMNSKLKKTVGISDTHLLLVIKIAVFLVMYISAVVFLGSGFTKPQTFFNILNDNAALIILSCGMSVVMITGGIGSLLCFFGAQFFVGQNSAAVLRVFAPTIFLSGLLGVFRGYFQAHRTMLQTSFSQIVDFQSII